MARAYWLLLAFALAGGAAAHVDQTSGPPPQHSPNVLDFYWLPDEPQRGQDVYAVATLADDANVTQVALRVCRVQAYACLASPTVLEPGGISQYAGPRATNPFHGNVTLQPEFFRGALQVGIAVIIQYEDGSREESPAASWPEHPEELPEGAGNYYFFSLPPEAPGVPAPALVLALTPPAAVAWVCARRTRR